MGSFRCNDLGKGKRIYGYAQADSDLEMPLGQSLKIGKTSYLHRMKENLLWKREKFKFCLLSCPGR